MIGRRTLLGRLAAATAVSTAASALGPWPHRAAAADPLVLWTSENEATRLRTIEYIATAYGMWTGLPAPVVTSVPEERIVTAVADARRNGKPPDLVNTGGDLLLALGEADLLDLETPSALIAEIGDFFEGAVLALTSTSGARAGIPLHGWPQVLWYRQDMFADAWLPPPTTVPNMLAAARALHEGELGRIGIVCGTDGGLYTQQFFAQLVRAEGGSLFATDGTPTLDDAPVHQALASYAALAAYGPAGPVNWRARDWYIQDRAGMMVYSTFIMDDLAIAGIARDSLQGGRFPGLNGADFDPDLVRKTGLVTALSPHDATYSVINGIALPRGADAGRRKAIGDFLKFIFRPDSYVVWLHMAPGGMLPVRKGVAASDAFLRDPIGVFRYFGRERVDQLAASLIHPGSFAHWHGMTVPNAATVHANGLVGRMVARVIARTMKPAASARAAQTEAEALLRRR